MRTKWTFEDAYEVRKLFHTLSRLNTNKTLIEIARQGDVYILIHEWEDGNLIEAIILSEDEE